MRWFVVGLAPVIVAISVAPVHAVFIDFEGLASTSLTSGTPPASAVLDTDLQNLGIHFGRSGLSPGVVVSNNTSAAFSNPNSINGLDAAGDIVFALEGDTYFNFVVPNTSTPAIVNSVSWVMGDTGGDLDEWRVRAYDLSNVNIIDQSFQSNDHIPVTLNAPGIHRVEVLWEAPEEGGYGLDNLSFPTPVSSVIIPEPSTILIWSLLAALGIGTAWRRRK